MNLSDANTEAASDGNQVGGCNQFVGGNQAGGGNQIGDGSLVHGISATSQPAVSPTSVIILIF